MKDEGGWCVGLAGWMETATSIGGGGGGEECQMTVRR